MKQFVYCRDLSNGPLDTAGFSAVGFFFCWHPRDLAPLKLALGLAFGYSGLLKTRLKLRLGNRAFYAVVTDNRLQHYGWVAFGFCKHYRVEKDSAIIGPVWTDPAARGKGLATNALKHVIRRLAASGVHRLYIDTSEDNTAMQHVIRRCGFATLSGTYIRRSDHTPGAVRET